MIASQRRKHRRRGLLPIARRPTPFVSFSSPTAEPRPRWNRQRFRFISAAERETDAVADQLSLFEANAGLPDGFRHRPDRLDEGEERALVAEIARLPFKAFEFHGFLRQEARRFVRLAR